MRDCLQAPRCRTRSCQTCCKVAQNGNEAESAVVVHSPGRYYGVFTPFTFLFEHFPIETGEQKQHHLSLVKKLEHFEQKKEYAVFCPTGQTSFDRVAELMRRAVLRCRQKKIKRLLIDSTRLPGFHPPGISERYNLAERIASDAKSLVKIAHVASPVWVRSGKCDVMVAKNRGLDAKNFHSEPEALKWLLTTAEKQSGMRSKTAFESSGLSRIEA